MLQPLPTIHYSPRHRFLRGPSPTYPFHTNGLQPYGLFNVTQGAVNLLDDMEEVLFPADYEKITFYFEVPGYTPFRRIRNVQSLKNGKKQPSTRAVVVRHVIKAIEDFILYTTSQRRQDATSIRLGAGGIELKHMYLAELRCYGKTFQPILLYDATEVERDALKFRMTQLSPRVQDGRLAAQPANRGGAEHSEHLVTSVANLMLMLQHEVTVLRGIVRELMQARNDGSRLVESSSGMQGTASQIGGNIILPAQQSSSSVEQLVYYQDVSNARSPPGLQGSNSSRYLHGPVWINGDNFQAPQHDVQEQVFSPSFQ